LDNFLRQPKIAGGNCRLVMTSLVAAVGYRDFYSYTW